MAVENFQDAFTAMLNAVVADSGVNDPDLHAKLVASQSVTVPPERLWNFGELVYANMDAVTPEMRAVAADVLSYAASYGFYGLGENQRGHRMAEALRAGAMSAGDPEPDSRFLPAVATPAP